MTKFTKPGQMLEEMIRIAVEAHAGQLDKGGRPYILHVLTVMSLVDDDDEEVECIAAGHDLIEDTSMTYAKLYEHGFSQRVVEGIDAMTKRRGETYDEYKARVKANKDAIKVKMADLQHNSDIKRLKGLTEKDFERVRKYHQFYTELKALT